MAAIYLGIDIGKHTHAWTMLSASLLKRHKRYQKCPVGSIKNSREGFESLLALARAEAGGNSIVHIVCEHTGHYGYALQQFFQEQSGIRLYRVIATKRYGRDKTDKKDSQALAVRLYNQVSLRAPVTNESERILPLRSPIAAASQLRPLVQHRVELTHEIVQRENRLTSILDQLFPEFIEIYAEPNGPSALNLREKYPTPKAIAEADLKGLIATRTWTRPSNKAFEKMQVLAKESIGLKEGHRLDSLIIEQAQLITELRLLVQHQAQLDSKISVILATTREGQILQSFPGIAIVLAAQLLSGIGNINNFPTLPKFRAYMGSAPRRTQTGTTYDSDDLDRSGNRLCKLAIRQATAAAIRHSPRWAALHTRLMAGPRAKGAMGRVAGQLCGVIYVLLKRDAELVARAADGVLPEPELYDSAHR